MARFMDHGVVAQQLQHNIVTLYKSVNNLFDLCDLIQNVYKFPELIKVTN